MEALVVAGVVAVCIIVLFRNQNSINKALFTVLLPLAIVKVSHTPDHRLALQFAGLSDWGAIDYCWFVLSDPFVSISLLSVGIVLGDAVCETVRTTIRQYLEWMGSRLLEVEGD